MSYNILITSLLYSYYILITSKEYQRHINGVSTDYCRSYNGVKRLMYQPKRNEKYPVCNESTGSCSKIPTSLFLFKLYDCP